MTLLQIDFPSHGPWGEELAKMVSDLAHHLNETPSMVWKIWTENSRTGDCGGVYLFTDETSRTTSRLDSWESKMCEPRLWMLTKAFRGLRGRRSRLLQQRRRRVESQSTKARREPAWLFEKPNCCNDSNNVGSHPRVDFGGANQPARVGYSR